MPIKEYTAGIFDQLVVGKTYRVEYYNGDVLLEKCLAKIHKISDLMISFKRQKSGVSHKPHKNFDVPTHEPNRMHYHYRIFETGEDITDRKLRGPALEQALQTVTMENPNFNEPIINTTKGMANGLFKAGRKYKTKMHKKKKMRTKKNTNKKMKKKQTRTRRKR
jgi:hypothetical protein